MNFNWRHLHRVQYGSIEHVSAQTRQVLKDTNNMTDNAYFQKSERHRHTNGATCVLCYDSCFIDSPSGNIISCSDSGSWKMNKRQTSLQKRIPRLMRRSLLYSIASAISPRAGGFWGAAGSWICPAGWAGRRGISYLTRLDKFVYRYVVTFMTWQPSTVLSKCEQRTLLESVSPPQLLFWLWLLSTTSVSGSTFQGIEVSRFLLDQRGTG